MRKLLADYGMVFVLIGLCALFSILTLKEQKPESSAAAAQLVEDISSQFDKTDTILAVNSFVNSYECAGVTYSCRVDTTDVLPWINSFLP